MVPTHAPARERSRLPATGAVSNVRSPILVKITKEYATRDSRLASHACGARSVAYLGGHIAKENLGAIFLLRHG
jgi:hypothetical protein